MQFYSFPLPVIYDPVVVALRITREFTLISFVLLNVNAGYRVAIKMKMKKNVLTGEEGFLYTAISCFPFIKFERVLKLEFLGYSSDVRYFFYNFLYFLVLFFLLITEYHNGNGISRFSKI